MATTKATTLAHTLGGISSDISTAEINRLDGVTGDIQDQLNLLAPKASPTFTGTANISSGATFPANPTITLGSNTTFPTNSILQLKHYSRGTSYSDSGIDASWTNIPSFEVAITPSSSSNKILVIANFRAGNNGTTSHNGLNFQFRRDIANAGYNNVGNQLQSNSKDNYGYCITHVMTLIDSPNTTSEIEYTVGYADIRAATGGSIFIGSINTGIENAYESVIMAMELKA